MGNSEMESKKLDPEQLEEVSGGILKKEDQSRYDRKISDCRKKGMKKSETLAYLLDGVTTEYDRDVIRYWVMMWYVDHYDPEYEG